MSKSRRKPIIKDKPRNEKSGARYHRTIRRVTNEKVRYLEDALEDEELPDPKSIVNNYDYSDWKQDFRFRDDEFSKKARRK